MAAFSGELGCHDRDGRHNDLDRAPGEVAEVASGAPSVGAAGLDAAPIDGIETAIDPPAAAGDLKGEMDRFTTIDQCVDERAHVDPILGDALEAIGYDTFLRDACRVIDAAKAVDPRRCSTIVASSLKARCRATVAEAARLPEACPWQAPGRRIRGRDATCVAIASRDLRLCAAVVDPLEHATCEATLARDGRLCARLRTGSEQARCTRDAQRWSAMLAAGENASTTAGMPDTKPFVATGKIRLEMDAAQGRTNTRADPIELDLSSDVSQGVVVVQELEGLRMVLGALSAVGPDFVAPSPHTRGSFAVELVVSDRASAAKPSTHGAARAAPANALVERLELRLPGRPPFSSAATPSTWVAYVDGVLPPTRGAPVTIEVSGVLGADGALWRLHAVAATFVRDVIRSTDLFEDSSRPPPSGTALGEEPGMR